MKKNKFLRLASVMLMLCLITTCAISGTFAKYTTSGTAGDTARVAKWGVTIVGGAESFETSYAKDDSSFTIDTDSVVSTSDKVLAPGTTGEMSDITITGTPEVAVRISLVATVSIEKWTVNAATYCPVIFTIGTETYGLTGVVDSEGNAATNVCADVDELETEIKEAIDACSKDCKVGDSLNVSLPISWEWAFEGNDDAKDTALANLEGTDAPTITISIAVTATQID